MRSVRRAFSALGRVPTAASPRSSLTASGGLSGPPGPGQCLPAFGRAAAYRKRPCQRAARSTCLCQFLCKPAPGLGLGPIPRPPAEQAPGPGRGAPPSPKSPPAPSRRPVCQPVGNFKPRARVHGALPNATGSGRRGLSAPKTKGTCAAASTMLHLDIEHSTVTNAATGAPSAAPPRPYASGYC
jgi:hypothetical protein